MFTSAARRVLSRAQWYICAGCGLPLDLKASSQSRQYATVDHVLPRSKGGHPWYGNVVVMHRACNEEKDDQRPNGCVCIWLLAVNNRLGVEPMRW